MKDEVEAAVAFLIRVVGKNSQLEPGQLDALRARLEAVLTDRFREHWFPERPSRGQAYRCIRINEAREPVLEQASRQCGLSYEELCLPAELTLWVDPDEVCCRFGERQSSYCILASFKGGKKENYVDQINIDDLEQRSMERSNQASMDMMSGRKRATGSQRGWGMKFPSYSPCLSGSPPGVFSQPKFLSRGGTLWNLSAALPPGQKPDKYHWVNKSVVKA